MSVQKFCESCGMPLRTKEDFGGGRLDNSYCIHCTDENGTLKSYDDVLEGMKSMIIKNMGISETEDSKMAKENLAKMSVWE